MSRRRRYQVSPERPSSRQWPLVVAFWAPWVAVAIYLGYAHRAHIWGALHWALLVAAIAALALRWKGRWARRSAPGAGAQQPPPAHR